MRYVPIVLALAGCNIPETHFTGGDGGGQDGTPVAPGEYIWVRSLSQMQTQTINGAASGIVTPGFLFTTANLNGTALTAMGGADLVIAAFTETDAMPLYAVRHGNVGSEFGLLAAVAPNGTPIVSGVTGGDQMVDLGKGPVTGGGSPNEDGYIGLYTNGVAGWQHRMVGPGSDKFLGSARGPGGTVYAAGWHEPGSTLDGVPLPSTGGRDIYITRYNVFTGASDLEKTFGGTGRDELSGGGIATRLSDPSTFVVAGFYDDTISFGGTAIPITANQGGLDMWIAKLDMNGNGIWAVTYGGAGDDRDVSVVLDDNGDVYITGTFTTAITLGTKTLNAVGLSDHFIAKLDGTNGSPIWAISFGSANGENAGRMTVDNKGHLAWAGNVSGALNGMPTAGGKDAYLAEFRTSDGSLIWDHLYSTAADDGCGGVVYGTVTGDLFASVSIGGAFDFGKPLIGDPAPLSVLIRIAP